MIGKENVNMNKNYIKVSIIETGKPKGSKESYQNWGVQRFTFKSAIEAVDFISDRYGKCKKVPMFVDDKQGKAIKIGKIYCYSIKLEGKVFVAQDWVEIKKVSEMALAI